MPSAGGLVLFLIGLILGILLCVTGVVGAHAG